MSTSLRASAAAFLLLTVGLGNGVSFAQNPRSSRLLDAGNFSDSRDGAKSPTIAPASLATADSRLGSDLGQDAGVDQVYQQVVKIHLQGDYAAAAQLYQSQVIPMAERSQSGVTRSKFLFLGYRGLGNCYLAMSRFSEAEAIFQKLFEYMPVWPGVNDAGYPINYESIAMARMGEQHWTSAEESLRKAISIFDDQIVEAARFGLEVGPDSVRNERANNLRISEAMALKLFAVVFFREQRYAEALDMLDRAYRQGIAFRAPSDVVQQIVDDGRNVSIAAGDENALAIWAQRSPARESQ